MKYEGQLIDDEDEYFDDGDYDIYCDECGGSGAEVICPDDLCHSDAGCIHGDGEIDCRHCGGSGRT